MRDHETALLGAIINYSECQYIVPEIQPEYFNLSDNSRLFEAISSLYYHNKAIAVPSVKEELEKQHGVSASMSQLFRYADDVSSFAEKPSATKDLLDTLIEKYKAREEERINRDIEFHSSSKNTAKVLLLAEELNALNRKFSIEKIKSLSKDKDSKPEFFLRDILPSPIYSFLHGISSSTYKDFPVEATFTFFLSFLASLAGRKFRITYRKHEDHAFFWSMVALPVGYGKTPIVKALIKPLSKLQAEAAEIYERELKEFKDSEKKRIKSPSAVDEFIAGKPEPKRKRFYLSDSTMETTLKAHSDNPNGLLWVKDELKGLFNSLGAYKGGRGEDKETLLSLGAGAFVSVARKETNIELLESAISLTGGIQPPVLKDLYFKDKDKDNGLWQRFAYVIYDSASRELNQEDVTVNDSILTRLYSHVISSEGANLVFADQEHVRVVSDYFNEEIDKAVTDEMKAYYSKCFGFFLRLCILLHILDSHFAHQPYDRPVTRATSDNAFSLMAAYIFHAEKLLGNKKKKNADQDLIEKILEKPLNKRNINDIAKTITRHADKPSDKARSLFHMAEEGGFGTINKANGKNWQFILKGETN
jgi:hypothetical protein